MNNPLRQSQQQTGLADGSRTIMSDEVFRGFQRITLETTGIELADCKRDMLVNRFGRRLDVLGLTCFEEYLKVVSEPNNPEASEFIDTVTTNLTYFFREPHHFQLLSETVLPELAARVNVHAPIRIWSAGCSSGAEPYTLAMVARDTAQTKDRTVKILCTDIDTKMVHTTSQGRYKRDQLRGLDDELSKRWFKQTDDGRYQADEKLRSMLICKQLNLFSHWPIKPGVDVIMCRNVLIYFNPSYQKKLLASFANIQRSGGYLFLGHSETLDGCKDTYRRVDNTVYQRV